MAKHLPAVQMVVCSTMLALGWLHVQLPPTPGERPASVKESSGDGPAIREDLHGDPLPQGAIFRVGTVRLRHGHSIKHLAFSPDQKVLASSSWDKTLRLWDAATGKEIRRFRLDSTRWSRNLPHEFTYFAFSPDGRTLAANQGKDLCLLDTATGKTRIKCRGCAEHFAFTPDGKTLLALYWDSVTHWDTETGKQLREWKHDKEDEHFFYRCRFSLDCQTMAIGDFSAEQPLIHIWDVRSGEKVRAWKAHENYIRDLAFSPDGKSLASLSDDESVRLWEVASGKEIRNWQKQSSLYHIAMSPDGKTLALSGVHRPLRLLDWTTGDELRSLDGGYGPVAFSGDGKLMAVAEANNSIRLWELPNGKPIHAADEIFDVGYSPDGKILVSRGSSGVQLWHLETGKLHREFATNGPVAVSPDGAVLALIQKAAETPDEKQPGPTRKPAASMTVVEMNTGKKLREFSIDRDNTWPVGWSEDAGVIALTTQPSGREWWWSAVLPSVRWYDWATGKEVRHLDGDMVVCSPDARTAAVLTHITPGNVEESNGGRIRRLTGTMRAVDARTGKDLFWLADCGTVIQETVGMNAFDPLFSANGAVLAAATADGKAVRLWNAKTGTKLTDLDAAAFHFSLFCFSPDGTRLAVKDKERTLCVLQAANGKVLHKLDTSFVEPCAFSADGNVLATVDLYQQISIWEVATGKPIRSWQPSAIRIRNLLFSPDGSSLTTLNSDGTALVWYLAGRLENGRSPAADFSDAELNQVWKELADKNAGPADRAIWKMVAGAEKSVPFLKQRLRPVPSPDANRLRQLLADLGSDRFAVREAATRELDRLGDVAGPAIEQRLADRPDVDLRERLAALLVRIEGLAWDGERLRGRRSVQVLEYTGTPEARQMLEELARGASGAQLSRDANASLERLARRQRPK